MSYILYASELIGTVAFALSGAILAVRKKLDLFGILFLGVVTALGGGTVRDLLLGHTPPRMFYNIEYVTLALTSALLVFFVARFSTHDWHKPNRTLDFLFVFSDALGLGIFSVVGTQAGISAGYGDNAFLCIILGMTTGVGGGILRDIMCNDIPSVLRKHIYAVAAIAGGASFYLLTRVGMEESVGYLTGMVLTVVLRLLAWHYHWNLPRVEQKL